MLPTNRCSVCARVIDAPAKTSVSLSRAIKSSAESCLGHEPKITPTLPAATRSIAAPSSRGISEKLGLVTENTRDECLDHVVLF